MIGLFIVFNVGYYVVFTFLQTYFIKTLKFSKTEAFMSMTLATFVALVLILPLAALSDRIGRKPMLIAGSVAFAVLGYPLFLLLNSGSLAAAITAHCALAAIESIYVSTAVSAGVEMFATTRALQRLLDRLQRLRRGVSAVRRPTSSPGSPRRPATTWHPPSISIVAAVISLLHGADAARDRGQTASPDAANRAAEQTAIQ